MQWPARKAIDALHVGQRVSGGPHLPRGQMPFCRRGAPGACDAGRVEGTRRHPEERIRGPLPLALVLDEGRHRVRYRFAGESTVRFYYVKAGATRSLDVVTRPGGFIDAR